jgi:hypothetical protein
MRREKLMSHLTMAAICCSLGFSMAPCAGQGGPPTAAPAAPGTPEETGSGTGGGPPYVVPERPMSGSGTGGGPPKAQPGPPGPGDGSSGENAAPPK